MEPNNNIPSSRWSRATRRHSESPHPSGEISKDVKSYKSQWTPDFVNTFLITILFININNHFTSLPRLLEREKYYKEVGRTVMLGYVIK